MSDLSLLSIMYYIVVMPIQIIFEIIFSIAFNISMNAGMSIFALSLAMNFLVLPLYNCADDMQAKAMALETKLSGGIKHIKKTFHGDEQLMMLQTYYRQNHYSPYNVVKCSLPVLLEIPFFIAAYDFLSQLDLLHGMTLGPIKDLGAADGLLVYGAYTINLLPIIMTLLNVVATYFFVKSYPMGTKIQLYGIAAFFLVFLYNSPAGLVLYWSLNNLFNLLKTILIKTKEPARYSKLLLALSGVGLLTYGLYFNKEATVDELTFCFLYSVITIIPMLWSIISRKLARGSKDTCHIYHTKLFVIASVFLTILLGVVIPSNIISASPQEFIIMEYHFNPMEYIAYSTAIAFGTFIVWIGVFRFFSSKDHKYYHDFFVCSCCILGLLNYLFFGRALGTINTILQYERGFYFPPKEIFINLALVVIIFFTVLMNWRKIRVVIYDFLLVGTIALVCVSLFNFYIINKKMKYDVVVSKNSPIVGSILNLSKEGKNVIVFMLDRAVGPYVPFIFNEKPELKKQFEGFIYYANTLSLGGCTNIGSPSLFGGYEYSPLGMNSRKDVSLKDKHNEALKIMPYLFDDKGFFVNVCDPTYANYQWIPDLSIFDERSSIKKYNTMGRVRNDNDKIHYINKKEYIKNNKRNFFAHSILKCMPVVIQLYIYDRGNYFSLLHRYGQQNISFYRAKGLSGAFTDSYNVLHNLGKLTKISEQGDNFLLLTNDTTHSDCMLSMPDYIPADTIDNSSYEATIERIDSTGKKLNFPDLESYKAYQSNMAAYLELGKWFEYLQKNNIYKNTRIILVSDHGSYWTRYQDYFTMDKLNTLRFRPLLMVKDFDSKGQIASSNRLMYNADVPRLAMQGIMENPINPFTGNDIFDNEFTRGKQYVFTSGHWSVDFNNGNQFIADDWYRVEGDINNMDNWHLVKKNAVLPY